jgi:tetratricopeptide (TPR) repeat protein
MQKLALLSITLTFVALAGGCTSYSFDHRDPNCNPDERLEQLLQEYDACLRDSQPRGRHEIVDCERTHNEIERLAIDFPTHVPTLMANAVLAHETRDDVKAKRYLDSVFSVSPAHAEAGALRAQLALDDGNVDLARRIVEVQIAYAPDHAALRELQSSVLFADHDFDGAKAAIGVAEKLGAPAWRVALNRGLISQALGDTAAARREYQAALDANPQCQQARARLAGINAGGGYNGGTSPPGKAGGG